MEWFERVKAIKKQKNITTEMLSEQTGIAKGTLNKLLTGQTKNPSYDTIERIAAALCTSVTYRAYGIEENSEHSGLFEKYSKLDQKGKEAVAKTIDAQLSRMESERAASAAQIGKRRKIFIYDVPVSAGLGSFLDSSPSQSITLEVNDVTDRADYAVRVSGDSMEPRFFDGDIVIVESCGQIPEGKVGIFLYNGESYIKKYGGDRLRSVNPKYADMVFKAGDDIRCLGLVLGSVSKQ